MKDTRGILIGILITVIGGMALFFLQGWWRDQVKLQVEIVPHVQFSARYTDESKLLNDFATDFVTEASKYGENLNGDSLKKNLIRYIEGFTQRSFGDCAYEVKVNNTGDLPAENVFISIRAIQRYVISDRFPAFDPDKFVPASSGTLLIGDVKQGEQINLVAFGNRFCEYDTGYITAGYKSGKASIRFVQFPNEYPDFFLNHPGWVLMTFFIIVGIVIYSILVSLFQLIAGLEKSNTSKSEGTVDLPIIPKSASGKSTNVKKPKKSA